MQNNNLVPNSSVVESETGEIVELLPSGYSAQARMDGLNKQVVDAIRKRASKNGISVRDIENGEPFILGGGQDLRVITLDDKLDACVMASPKRGRIRRLFAL